MIITEKSTLSEYRSIPELEEISRYLLYWGDEPDRQMEQTPFEVLGQMGWNVSGILKGAVRVRQQAEMGKLLYPIYSDAEIATDPARKDMNVIFLPKTVQTGEKPFVLVIAGGGYRNICTFSEAFPLAARLNELGYDAFCLTYRVGKSGVFPHPMEDLAAAVRTVLANRQSFGVSGEYIVSGFSAGGNLTALWGTVAYGYAAYDLPAPRAMFPVYPVVSGRIPGGCPELQGCFLAMVGERDTDKKLEQYDVLRLLDSHYPPCYITCGKNDGVVNPANSEQLKAGLDALGIPAVLDESENAQHGFGDGEGTTAAGWIDRAVAFAEKLG